MVARKRLAKIASGIWLSVWFGTVPAMSQPLFETSAITDALFAAGVDRSATFAV